MILSGVVYKGVLPRVSGLYKGYIMGYCKRVSQGCFTECRMHIHDHHSPCCAPTSEINNCRAANCTSAPRLGLPPSIPPLCSIPPPSLPLPPSPLLPLSLLRLMSLRRLRKVTNRSIIPVVWVACKKTRARSEGVYIGGQEEGGSPARRQGLGQKGYILEGKRKGGHLQEDKG